MKTSFKTTLGIALFSLFIIAGNVHAAALPAASLDEFYTTLAYPNPISSQNNFNYDDAISTWFSFSNVNSVSPIELQWTWTHLDGAATPGVTTKTYYFTYDEEDPYLSFSKRAAGNIEGGTQSFENWWQSTGRKVGDWNVNLAWKNGDIDWQTNEHSSFNFKVAPEPVSSVLFLVGGLAMGGRALKRKFSIA